MKKIYLDNAATTPLYPEVIDAMVSVLQNDFGNPSSTHSYGRSAKNLLETARKSIAKRLHVLASELIFTAHATEATNLILQSAVQDLGIKRIITSKIEHHATLHTILHLEKTNNIEVVYINILPTGLIDYLHLAKLLHEVKPTLVSLMHVNNEIGTILDVDRVGKLCVAAKALFHCDTVQSIGKIDLNLHELPIDFAVATAHKFHGPKGIGFAYIKKGLAIQPMIYGGEQEKGLRAGTEAVHQVVGMAKALEVSLDNLDENKKTIMDLQSYCLSTLLSVFPNLKVNGTNTLYNILNVMLPIDASKASMLLFALDMKGIAVSRGSACQSGSIKPSHVLAEFLNEEEQKFPNLRISFSQFNTREEIDYFIEVLKEIK
ncbi:cysteine desulfurase family protein [Flavobacterium sp.]|uniref:cysteine desulfurase family protein n=1 Tax=Flavobacterium sp. TaxID=239 RepID=UPI003D28AC38